jgi:hypothetical protein
MILIKNLIIFFIYTSIYTRLNILKRSTFTKMSTNTSESVHLTAGDMLEYNKLTKPEIREVIKNESKEIAKGMEYALRLQGFFSVLPLTTGFKIENITLDNGEVLGQITISRKNWKDFKKVLFHRMGQLPRVIADLTKATRKTQPFTGANRPVRYKETAIDFLRAANLGPCVHVEFVRREDKAGNPAFIVDRDTVEVVPDCQLQQYLYTLADNSPMHGIFPASLFASAVSLNAYYSGGIISYANTGVYSATPEMRKYLRADLEALIRSQAAEAIKSADLLGGNLTLNNQVAEHIRSIDDTTINRGERQQYTMDINGKELKFTLFNPNGFIFADLSKLSSMLTVPYKVPDLTTAQGHTLNESIARFYAELIPGINEEVSRAYYVVLSSLRNTMRSALAHKNILLSKEKAEAKKAGILNPTRTTTPSANIPPTRSIPSKTTVPGLIPTKTTVPGLIPTKRTFQAPTAASTQPAVNLTRQPSGESSEGVPSRTPTPIAFAPPTQPAVNLTRQPSGESSEGVPSRTPTPIAFGKSTQPAVNLTRQPNEQAQVSSEKSPAQEGAPPVSMGTPANYVPRYGSLPTSTASNMPEVYKANKSLPAYQGLASIGSPTNAGAETPH